MLPKKFSQNQIGAIHLFLPVLALLLLVAVIAGTSFLSEKTSLSSRAYTPPANICGERCHPQTGCAPPYYCVRNWIGKWPYLEYRCSISNKYFFCAIPTRAPVPPAPTPTPWNPYKVPPTSMPPRPTRTSSSFPPTSENTGTSCNDRSCCPAGAACQSICENSGGSYKTNDPACGTYASCCRD